MLAAAGKGQPMQNLSPQHGLADSLDHLSSIGTKITKEFYSRQITSENLEIIWQLLHPQKHKQTYMALVLSGSVRMLFQLVDPNDLPWISTSHSHRIQELHAGITTWHSPATSLCRRSPRLFEALYPTCAGHMDRQNYAWYAVLCYDMIMIWHDLVPCWCWLPFQTQKMQGPSLTHPLFQTKSSITGLQTKVGRDRILSGLPSKQTSYCTIKEDSRKWILKYIKIREIGYG